VRKSPRAKSPSGKKSSTRRSSIKPVEKPVVVS
jgi:hypothetical protein